MRFWICFLFLIHFEISRANIKSDVEYLASDLHNGRLTGTKENIAVQNWLIKRLTELKVRPAGDLSKTKYQFEFKNSYDFLSKLPIEGTNILGIVYPQNKWSDEPPKVFLGAHFDHKSSCTKKFENPDDICNGATDNATSVAILLSVIESLSKQIKTPVAIAFWDAEELGLLGSDAFLKNPSFDLSMIKTYINLDIVGSNIFRGFENHHVILGAETGGKDLIALAQEISSKESAVIQYHQLSYAFGHGRSDMTSFLRHGYKIPSLFFSDADGAVYHSNSDEVKHVNFAKVESVARVVLNLTNHISENTKLNFKFKQPTILMDKGTFWGNILRIIFGSDHILKVGIPVPEVSDVPTVKLMYKKLFENRKVNLLSDETVKELEEIVGKLDSIDLEKTNELGITDSLNVLTAGAYFTKTAKELSFIP